MLRRIFVIGVFTGAGQLYSVFVLKFISQHCTSAQLNEIAQLDSLIFFIMNIIAFGLQSSAIRNLALAHDWKHEYYQTQSARIAMGIILVIGSALALVNKYYLIFLIAPLLAWSGDYALYARGSPVAGSFISFLRLIISFSLVLMAGSFFPSYIGLTYAFSLGIIYLLTNLLISAYLKVPFFFKPGFKALKLYISSFQLGVVAISLYFIGLGLVLITPYFYSSQVVGLAFLGLKFYILYKGILRMIHQAFVQEMADEEMCLKVDQLSIMIGFMFFGSVFIFPESFIALFFGKKFVGEENFFRLLALAALVYSFFLSMATRSMLQKKDKQYSLVAVLAASITLLSCVLLSFYRKTTTSLSLSLCLGELTWTIGLIKISARKWEIKNRLFFGMQITLLLLLPLVVRYFLGDRLPVYLTGLGLFSLILLLLHHKKFKI